MSKRTAPQRPTAYLNARLLDPASGLDAPGSLLVEGETITAVGRDLYRDGRSWRAARPNAATAPTRDESQARPAFP